MTPFTASAEELARLVAAVPALPVARLRALAAEARAVGEGATPPVATLATALAAALERYAEGAAPLAGWVLVAQAGELLARAAAAPGAMAASALAAAAFELDSLAAPAATAARPPPAAPDVPLTSLRRRT